MANSTTASLLVRWQEGADAEGYVIHWGRVSGVYDHELDVGAPTSSDGVVSFRLEGVATSTTIYLALTSYDGEANMSGLSNELSASVP